VVLFPSLALLFRLALTGRFDPDAPAREDDTGRSRRSLGAPLGARAAAALLIAGVGLLNVAAAPWAHAVGVVSLLAFVVTAFLQIAPRAIADQG
jgi:cytochrome d ubiquinol oxidase subunit II